MVCVMVDTCRPTVDISAMTRPEISSTQIAGSSVTSGAMAARNTITSMTRMTRIDRFSVSFCALACEFWLSTALGSCPVRYPDSPAGSPAWLIVDRTAATVGAALVLEVRTLKTTWALSARPSWDRP